ncbi:MAG: signal peptidase II [Pseudomonadota bacterium]
MQLAFRLILPAALAIFLFDRLTKWWIVVQLDLQNVQQIDVFAPYLRFVMAWNTGINFGLFGDADARWFLVVLSVVISAALLWWASRRGSAAIAIGAGFVIGGAIGNAWDRASDWGAVADFLNMSCCGIDNPFSFNVADIAIFLGAIWIAIKA